MKRHPSTMGPRQTSKLSWIMICPSRTVSISKPLVQVDSNTEASRCSTCYGRATLASCGYASSRGERVDTRETFFRGLSSCRFVDTTFGPGLSLVPLILLAHIMMSVIGFSVPQRAFPVDTNASCGLFAGVVFSLVGPGARGTCATAVVGYPLNMQVAVRAR